MIDKSQEFQVCVGSRNPVKSQAIEGTFQTVFRFPSNVSSVNVKSRVSDQPMSDSETLRGAQHRAHAAMVAKPNCDYYVGVEGGIEQHSTGMLAFAWIVIKNSNLTGYARTATFPLPHAIAEMVRDGIELGIANDTLFGVENSKHAGGAVGHLTGGTIDRTELYQHAAVLALIPFTNPQHFAAAEKPQPWEDR